MLPQAPLSLARKIKKEKNKDKEKEKEKDKDKERITNSPVPAPAPRSRRKAPKTTTYVDDDLDDLPLKSIKKEMKPEETVSMERHYFGQFGGKGEQKRVAIAVEVSCS